MTKYFIDYQKAKAQAEKEGLRECEYGDYDEKIRYCCWNKSGDRDDEVDIECYYTSVNGRPAWLAEWVREVIGVRDIEGEFNSWRDVESWASARGFENIVARMRLNNECWQSSGEFGRSQVAICDAIRFAENEDAREKVAQEIEDALASDEILKVSEFYA